jgi:hypothetical protein
LASSMVLTVAFLGGLGMGFASILGSILAFGGGVFYAAWLVQRAFGPDQGKVVSDGEEDGEGAE